MHKNCITTFWRTARTEAVMKSRRKPNLKFYVPMKTYTVG